jgi:outer membrane protein assembly factor BamB
MPAILVTFVMLTVTAFAADWPQWRGPVRTGVSPETGLLKEWPKDGPTLLWQIKDIGYGYSTPAVVGDRLYLLSSEGLENEMVQARSVKDGSKIWSTRIGNVGHPKQVPDYTGARSTPTVEGDVLYALGSDGDVVCLETATGKPRWQKNIRTEFGGQYGQWAYAESPLIDGDVLVCAPGGKEATILALNKKTGAVIWKTALPEADDAAYTSALIVTFAGRKQYVEFLRKGLVGVDAATGQFLWRFTKTADKQAGMNMQTPVVQGDLIYSATNFGGGLLRLSGDKDAMKAEEVYFNRDLPNSIGGTVLVGGHLYGTNKSEGLVCVEFETGTIKWKDKCIGPASVCCADGNLYIHGENGQVALVEATPEVYREKGRFTPPEEPKHKRGIMEKAWSYPVVANGRFYIHDIGTVWCYDVSGK